MFDFEFLAKLFAQLQRFVARLFDALERFVGLPPSPLEKREKLEQLRALEAGMRIDVEVVASVPLGVDTPEDLARARAVLSGRA